MIDELRSALHQAQTGTPEGSLERAIGVYQHAGSLISHLEAVQAEAKLLISEIFLETRCTAWISKDQHAGRSSSGTGKNADGRFTDSIRKKNICVFFF